MRRYLFPAVLLLPAISVFMLFSCKKKNNSNPYGNQRIATVDKAHNGAIEHYVIVYDLYNNVDSMIITGGGTDTGSHRFMKFNYVGSSFSITDQNNNTIDIYANTSGQLLKVLVRDTVSFTYTGSELGEENVYTPSPTPPYYVQVASYYNWVNGDVTYYRTGSTDVTYTYNNSRSGQPGDALRINDFLAYGQSVIKTTHLPAGMQRGSESETYLYTFDGNGRISQLTYVTNDATAGATDTVTYAYGYYY